MLSFVLPLLACAIVLTPVVASARAAYEREIDEQTVGFSSGNGRVTEGLEPFEQSDRVKQSLPVETTT